MPQYREITIHRIAQTTIDPRGMREWLDSIGARDFEIPAAQPVGTVVCGVAAKSCYNAFGVSAKLNPNIKRVRDNWREYIENILSQRHGSVLQHANYTYAINNCTRVFTAEMNRHHAGVAVSERSLRYVRFGVGDLPFWLPMSIRPAEWFTPSMLQYVVDDNYTEAAAILHEKHYRLYSEIDVRDVEVELRKAATVEVFTDILTKIEHAYARLTSIWEVDLEGDRFGVKKTITSMMRRILPLGICTGVVYTFNLRALRNIFEQRISPGAEEEIVGVAAAIARDVIQQEPDIFCDFINLDGYWIPKEMSDAAANKKMFAVNKYHKV